MKITEDVAMKIKTIRKVRKITQQDMADKLCISKNHYVKIESGKTDFKISYAEKIATILGIRYNILFEN